MVALLLLIVASVGYAVVRSVVAGSSGEVVGERLTSPDDAFIALDGYRYEEVAQATIDAARQDMPWDERLATELVVDDVAARNVFAVADDAGAIIAVFTFERPLTGPAFDAFGEGALVEAVPGTVRTIDLDGHAAWRFDVALADQHSPTGLIVRSWYAIYILGSDDATVDDVLAQLATQLS